MSQREKLFHQGYLDRKGFEANALSVLEANNAADILTTLEVSEYGELADLLQATQRFLSTHKVTEGVSIDELSILLNRLPIEPKLARVSAQKLARMIPKATQEIIGAVMTLSHPNKYKSPSLEKLASNSSENLSEAMRFQARVGALLEAKYPLTFRAVLAGLLTVDEAVSLAMTLASEEGWGVYTRTPVQEVVHSPYSVEQTNTAESFGFIQSMEAFDQKSILNILVANKELIFNVLNDYDLSSISELLTLAELEKFENGEVVFALRAFSAVHRTDSIKFLRARIAEEIVRINSLQRDKENEPQLEEYKRNLQLALAKLREERAVEEVQRKIEEKATWQAAADFNIVYSYSRSKKLLAQDYPNLFKDAKAIDSGLKDVWTVKQALRNYNTAQKEYQGMSNPLSKAFYAEYGPAEELLTPLTVIDGHPELLDLSARKTLQANREVTTQILAELAEKGSKESDAGTLLNELSTLFDGMGGIPGPRFLEVLSLKTLQEEHAFNSVAELSSYIFDQRVTTKLEPKEAAKITTELEPKVLDAEIAGDAPEETPLAPEALATKHHTETEAEKLAKLVSKLEEARFTTAESDLFSALNALKVESPELYALLSKGVSGVADSSYKELILANKRKKQGKIAALAETVVETFQKIIKEGSGAGLLPFIDFVQKNHGVDKISELEKLLTTLEEKDQDVALITKIRMMVTIFRNDHDFVHKDAIRDSLPLLFEQIKAKAILSTGENNSNFWAYMRRVVEEVVAENSNVRRIVLTEKKASVT